MSGVSRQKRQVVIFGDYFGEFYQQQSEKVRLKIDWTIGIVRDFQVIPGQYFRHIAGTDLYEVRVAVGNDIFRIFCFFDTDNSIVLLNGFQKKDQKTPRAEIEKALKIKCDYHEDKS